MLGRIATTRLTNAGGGENPDALVGRLAVREERLGGVLGEGQGHDGHGARADDQALGPQPDKAHERPESVQDVGVVSTSLPVDKITKIEETFQRPSSLNL